MMSLFNRNKGREGSEGKSKKSKSSRKKETEMKEQEAKQNNLKQQQELQNLQNQLAEKTRLEEERRQMEVVLLSEEEARRRGAIMDKTEQGGEKFDFNLGTMGLVDRLEAHPAGKLLKNVVISNEEPPDREINITRLRRFKPQNDFAKMTLGDIPDFDLNSEFVEFPITDAMTQSQFDSLKKYVLVSDIFIHYIPLDSFFSVSAPVLFQLNDFRKVDNTTMREYPLTHSGGYNILMTLDYCVAKKDLKYLSLSISTSLSSFRKDVSWASAKVLLTISHMDFPVKANIQETMGVLHLADSDLKDYISDPRHSDGVITPQAFKMLKDNYKRGEIENINMPRDDTKSVNVARTVVGAGSEDVNARDLMASLRQNALSAERSRSMPPPSRPVLKKSSSSARPMSPTVEDDRGDLDNLSEPDMDDSFSTNESEHTIELPRNNEQSRGNMRSVNFG